MKLLALILGGASALLALAPRAGAQVTGVSGGGQPFTNVQPSLTLNHIIRTEGVFTDIGEVKIFAGNFAPGGFALADGALLPISQNQALFAKLGTTYGGDGRTTFALPDLRGRASLGVGTGPGLTEWSLGQEAGTESVTLTEAQMPGHGHTVPQLIDPTGVTGGGQPHSTIQPSLALNYSIVVEGIYPSSGGGGTGGGAFIGQVRRTAAVAASLPTSEAPAAGQLLAISQDTALFSLLGTTYGGNGQTTFALPDLQGRVPMHAGTGPGLSQRVLGEEPGAELVTLTQAQLPPHSHTLPPSSDMTGITGGGQPHATVQPSLALNYIIALQGIYPSREGGNDETFIGEVALFAGNFAPGGWAFADGQLLAIAQNTALFSLLGTTYGGNGQTTFALPDLRGRVAIDDGQGPGLTDRQLGEITGAEAVTLTVGQLPPHIHTVVPEPAGAWLLGFGAAAVMRRMRRRA